MHGGKGGGSAALQVGMFHSILLSSLSLGGAQAESWRRRGPFAMPLKRREEQAKALKSPKTKRESLL